MQSAKAPGCRSEGFDKVRHRNVLYELNCFSERGEYAILEILEMTKEGTRLDYAKVGTYKDWQFVPEGSTMEKLCKAACPPRRN